MVVGHCNDIKFGRKVSKTLTSFPDGIVYMLSYIVKIYSCRNHVKYRDFDMHSMLFRAVYEHL